LLDLKLLGHDIAISVRNLFYLWRCNCQILNRAGLKQMGMSASNTTDRRGDAYNRILE